MAMKKNVISMKGNREGKTIDDGFKEFIKGCMIKNMSPYTVKSYELHFKRLERFAEAKETTMLEEIDKDFLNNYIIHLKGELQNAISINTYLRAARAYLYFCMKLGYASDFKIELIKSEKKIKETFSESELKLLLKKPNIKKCTFVEYRDWVIINF